MCQGHRRVGVREAKACQPWFYDSTQNAQDTSVAGIHDTKEVLVVVFCVTYLAPSDHFVST